MTEPVLYTLASVAIVSLIAFIGIFALSIKAKLLNKILFFLVAFAAGSLLGDVFIHLLPEYVEEFEFTLAGSLTILAGMLVMFILEKFIHWHHCHHGAVHGHDAADHHKHTKPYAIMNLIGDGFHNFIDGMIIAASYMISIPVGIATSVAVVFHEIPQEIGDFGVLVHGGFSRKKALLFNFFSAVFAVVGAVLTLIVLRETEMAEAYLIPFTIGSFLYIATADLIPELHKEVKTKRSVIQLIAIILGILVMASLLLLE